VTSSVSYWAEFEESSDADVYCTKSDFIAKD